MYDRFSPWGFRILAFSRHCTLRFDRDIQLFVIYWPSEIVKRKQNGLWLCGWFGCSALTCLAVPCLALPCLALHCLALHCIASLCMCNNCGSSDISVWNWAPCSHAGYSLPPTTWASISFIEVELPLPPTRLGHNCIRPQCESASASESESESKSESKGASPTDNVRTTAPEQDNHNATKTRSGRKSDRSSQLRILQQLHCQK